MSQPMSQSMSQYRTEVTPVEPVYVQTITPQPIMQSYERSDEESSEESENEDHTTEPLPSAVAGEPAEGRVLVTVVWIGGVVGAFCMYPM